MIPGSAHPQASQPTIKHTNSHINNSGSYLRFILENCYCHRVSDHLENRALKMILLIFTFKNFYFLIETVSIQI